MINASLKEMGAALASKKISSRELTGLFLERIANCDKAINAFVTVDPERSLAEADAVDQRLANGETGSLLGIPLAQKDIFCTKGWLTTCGSKMLSNFVAPYDSTVTKKLIHESGMVSLGKLNMDEFAMGSSNETSFYGPVKNPWNTICVPGGSSGGSAAAVAARMAPVATGTDTGGSIRQPAALCNLTAIKPTYGLVSRYGMIAFASSLDQAGPMAKNAEDCALLLSEMVGFDEKDSTSLQRPKVNYRQDLEKPLSGLRIGLPKEFFGDQARAGCDEQVMQAVDAAVAEYQRLGAKIVEVSLPNSPLCVAAYYVIAPAEASSNLSRFDGTRYGYRAPTYSDLTDMYEKTRAEGFGEEVKRRILIGTYVLSHGYYDAYYLQAQRVRRLIANDFQSAFKQCDIIFGPTSPSTAFELGAKTADPVQMYLSDIYTISVNLAGLPAMSLPCGFNEQNLPVGLQLIGNYFTESHLLNVAHEYQKVSDWHARSPNI